jgi:hypothetical protein
VLFWELRAGKFLENSECENVPRRASLQATRGHLEKDLSYYTHFSHMTHLPNAIYSHKYSPSGGSLFLGGGPLMVGLKGSYAAVWE